MEQTGRPWAPSVADEREYARSRMVLRQPSSPPAAAESKADDPDGRGPYALAPLPWSGRPHLLGKPLTEREVEVLGLIRDGTTNKQAAFELGCSEQTVKNHVSSLMAKLGASDRTTAVIIAFRTGVLAIDGKTSDPASLSIVNGWFDVIEQRLGEIEGITRRLAEAVERGRSLITVAHEVIEPDPEVAARQCSVQGCEAPIAVYQGHGRPPTRCEGHIFRRAAA